MGKRHFLSSGRCNVLQDYALGQVEQNSKVRARQLCNALQSLGPSFVKIGQALSSRPDLLPQIYLEVGYLFSLGKPGCLNTMFQHS